ncbi:secretin N-terminal domain-containing protein, partial [Providencia alcalifaciens]
MKIGMLIAIFCMTTVIWAHTRDPFFPENRDDEKISSTFIEAQTPTTEQSEELHHQLYPLNYADAERLGEQLSNHTIPLLSQQGRVIIDREANSLSIVDNSKTLSEIGDWLKLRDTPQQQVHITAHI